MTRLRPTLLVAGSALALFLSSLPVASDPAPDGDAWDVTSHMTMPGMPMQMPARTQRVCAKRDQAPAENPDPNCHNTSMQRTGNKLTWQVECTGEHAMSGRGEITFQGDGAYTGTIQFESAEGGMVIELSGKRVGSCTTRG